MKREERRTSEQERRDRLQHERKHRGLQTKIAAAALVATALLGGIGLWQTYLHNLRADRPKLVVTDVPRLAVKDGSQIIAFIPISNQGVSSAEHVTTQVSFLQLPGTLSSRDLESKLDQARRALPFAPDADLGASVSRITEAHTTSALTPEEHASIRNGAETLLLTESLRYVDRAGSRYETNACFRVMAGAATPDVLRGMLSLCPFGNNAE